MTGHDLTLRAAKAPGAIPAETTPSAFAVKAGGRLEAILRPKAGPSVLPPA